MTGPINDSARTTHNDELAEAALLEVSVVMPCLDEIDTLPICIEKAQQAFRLSGIQGEVIVADNGSTDGSREAAVELGARLICVKERGYGAALMGGIAAARGTFVIMGDADDSYDFLEIPKFLIPLREGNDLVQGCRLPRGGGRVMPGAMPPLHRWIGNPLLSWLMRAMFRIPINDVYCGLRGFRKSFYESLDVRSTGMEFATEMIIRAGSKSSRLSEVPITLHPDGRRRHGPHLRTFRDGWRTLRLFMIYSPRWTFFFPGTALVFLGLIGYALALPQIRLAGIALDVHTLLIASLMILLGYQAVVFAVLARIFASRERMVPPAPRLEKLSVEATLVAGLGMGTVGVGLIAAVVVMWAKLQFGALNYPTTMRWVIPGVTLIAAGFQTMLAALFVGVLKMHRLQSDPIANHSSKPDPLSQT
jgi:glycosyltransferase involved in cell wall biosynthesis